MTAGDHNAKVAKKLAKAAAKSAKKQPGPVATTGAANDSPAARAAAAAERQVALHRWRVIIGIVSVVIAAATLLIMLTRR